jgi:hypothetical protein
VAPSEDPDQSTWQRFLGGKTGAQQFMLALGALAGAALAIGALIAGAFTLLSGGNDPHPGAADESVQRVENQSAQAGEFVEFLLRAAGGAPVDLDHQVITPKGDGHFRLEYNCQPTRGCNFVRLETGNDIPAEIADGVWYQGCWSVEKDGAGYGADHLDIELTKQGDVCPA